VGEALERSLGEPFLDVAPAVDNSPPTLGRIEKLLRADEVLPRKPRLIF
jgi:hypothetical protein